MDIQFYPYVAAFATESMDIATTNQNVWYMHTVKHIKNGHHNTPVVNCEAVFGEAELILVEAVGDKGHCDVEVAKGAVPIDALQTVIEKSTFTVCPKDSRIMPNELRLAIHSQEADGSVKNYALRVEFRHLNYYSIITGENPAQFCRRMLESIKEHGMFLLQCIPKADIQLTGECWKKG